ncbi:MAG: DUF3618 domain-containing protein [Actinomycetaceae bacterium]|nr:DUF3618 domain-containing protein [Actinomycetaceae bacterium]
MSDERTPEQIEADLARIREEMTSTVDELVNQINPKENAKRAVADIKEVAQETGKKAQATIGEAKQGDPKAIKMVAIAGAVVLLVGGLIVRKILR